MATTTRDRSVYKVKLAEQAERYEEMVEFMEQVVVAAASEGEAELSAEERNLLSVAYKNVIGARRASWRIVSSIEQKEEGRGNHAHADAIRAYRTRIESELASICGGILRLHLRRQPPLRRGPRIQGWEPHERGFVRFLTYLIQNIMEFLGLRNLHELYLYFTLMLQLMIKSSPSWYKMLWIMYAETTISFQLYDLRQQGFIEQQEVLLLGEIAVDLGVLARANLLRYLMPHPGMLMMAGQFGGCEEIAVHKYSNENGGPDFKKSSSQKPFIKFQIYGLFTFMYSTSE